MTRNFHGERISTPFWQKAPTGIECPDCMPKHRADLAQPEEWRDEHGVRAEGWLHPSRNHSGLMHCNCCGGYYDRCRTGQLVRVEPETI